MDRLHHDAVTEGSWLRAQGSGLAALGVGLQISGHTHGGQIFPWTLFVRLDQPYIAGLSQHEGTQIYVSRGTGYWGPPMRVAAPAEITVLELTSGAAANASEPV